MAFKFNPFTGNFDDVADVAEKVESSDASVTDNAVVRWDGTSGLSVQNSGVTIDDSDNVIIPGDLTVNGTTTTVNSATLDVTDSNITVNNGGNDASAEGAGLTVERTGTDGSFVYEDALTTKFKIGALGSEVEIADISSAQTLTNKTIDADNNTIVDIANANISTTAAIAFSKMESLTADRATITSSTGVVTASAVTATELGYVSGVTSAIQTQLNDKQDTSTLTTKGDIYVRDASGVIRLGVGSDDQILTADSSTASGLAWRAANNFVFSVNSVSTNTSAVSGETYLVDTGSTVTITLPAPAADAHVRIKDSTGTANANNITVNPNGAETIDGAASFTMNSNYEAKIFVSDGTNWFVM